VGEDKNNATIYKVATIYWPQKIAYSFHK